jgi:hypothetical protein
MFDLYFVPSRSHAKLSAALAPHYTLAWQLSASDAVERSIAYARSIGKEKATDFLLDAYPGHLGAEDLLMEKWASGRAGVILGARTQAEFDEAMHWRSAVLVKRLGLTAEAVEMLLNGTRSEHEQEQEHER